MSYMLQWDDLEKACAACTRCSLHLGRTKPVFGVGNREANVLFVGEGPGAQEDASGIPFVGRAGKLLDDMLLSVGLTRERVYIANIVKCRPPENRDPLEVEQEACIEYMLNQVALLNQKLIVCMVRIAYGRIIR